MGRQTRRECWVMREIQDLNCCLEMIENGLLSGYWEVSIFLRVDKSSVSYDQGVNFIFHILSPMYSDASC